MKSVICMVFACIILQTKVSHYTCFLAFWASIFHCCCLAVVASCSWHLSCCSTLGRKLCSRFCSLMLGISALVVVCAFCFFQLLPVAMQYQYIRGSTCTRACRFCNVKTGIPDKINDDEPKNLPHAVYSMNLSHVVITSVDRDDLKDGGASQFAKCIQQIRKLCPYCPLNPFARYLQRGLLWIIPPGWTFAQSFLGAYKPWGRFWLGLSSVVDLGLALVFI